MGEDVTHNAIVLHDNATAHTADIVKKRLRRWRWEALDHPTYSPDPTPSNFDFIPKLKASLPGRRFHTREDIANADARIPNHRTCPSFWTLRDCVVHRFLSRRWPPIMLLVTNTFRSLEFVEQTSYGCLSWGIYMVTLAKTSLDFGKG
ncbi:hypothetical protein C0J52_16814 [Blattella germanica]|nr:hypothetical protein C0J52_16814 [Blattella germanica]